MQVKLSPRLAAITEYVPQGAVVADIGTDHGYLPVYLMKNNISPKVIASDVHQKPLNTAIELIDMLNLTQKIDVRLGDGLEVLSELEADVVIIAGMGGLTITHILESSMHITKKVQRLILQPMQEIQAVREWLMKNHFQIIDETLVEDDGIIYEVIASEPGQTSYSYEELYIGPCIIKKKDPLTKKHISQRHERIQKALTAMEKSETEATQFKREDYNRRLKILSKVIECL